MKAYYKIDQKTQQLILELKKKCIELDLGNVSFQYYNSAEFYLTEYTSHWELIVKQTWKKTTDIYRITKDGLYYQYSEKD